MARGDSIGTLACGAVVLEGQPFLVLPDLLVDGKTFWSARPELESDVGYLECLSYGGGLLSM